MTARAVGFVAVAAALSCASPPPPPAPPPPQALEARLSVEILRGFSDPPAQGVTGPERVEVLLDLTSSMEAATEAGPERFRAALQSAARLVEALPEESSVAVHALGSAGSGECNPALRTRVSGEGEARDALLEQLKALRPAGEASLAEAVASLRISLAATGTLARSRVVVITDLGEECGGDLCAELGRLVAGGSRVEMVVLGGQEVPFCIQDFELVGAPPSDAGPARIPFAVRSAARSEDGSPALGALGFAGDEPLTIAAGVVYVSVALDPPLDLGPVLLSPGITTRLRIVDFPALDPPVREWTWETSGGDESAAGRPERR